MTTAVMTAMPAAMIHLLDLGTCEIVLIGDGGLRSHFGFGTVDVQILVQNQQRRGADRGSSGSHGTRTGGDADGEFQEITTFHILILRMNEVDGTTVPHQP